MISIEQYTNQRKDEVNLLRVKPEQTAFTIGNVGEFISALLPHEHPYLIIRNGSVVGFFLLDLLYTETYGFSEEKVLGIRSLLIDQRFQRQGIANQAIRLLPSYVVTHYPNFTMLQLTVNCRNKAAYECYRQCGFEALEELYRGGPAGPQYIMQRNVAESMRW